MSLTTGVGSALPASQKVRQDKSVRLRTGLIRTLGQPIVPGGTLHLLKSFIHLRRELAVRRLNWSDLWEKNVMVRECDLGEVASIIEKIGQKFSVGLRVYGLIDFNGTVFRFSGGRFERKDVSSVGIMAGIDSELARDRDAFSDWSGDMSFCVDKNVYRYTPSYANYGILVELKI